MEHSASDTVTIHEPISERNDLTKTTLYYYRHAVPISIPLRKSPNRYQNIQLISKQGNNSVAMCYYVIAT